MHFRFRAFLAFRVKSLGQWYLGILMHLWCVLGKSGKFFICLHLILLQATNLDEQGRYCISASASPARRLLELIPLA